MSKESFIKRFNSFENIYNLNELSVNGDIPIWEIIRRDIFLNLQDDVENLRLNREKHGIKSIIYYLSSFIKSLFMKNPFFIKTNIEILIFSKSRKKLEGGEFINIYTDEICNNIKSKYSILEKSYKYTHNMDKNYAHTYYFDLIEFPSFIISKFFLRKDGSLNSVINHINECIKKEFGEISFNLNSIVYSKYYLFIISKYLISKLIDEIKPSKVLLYVSYNIYCQALTFVAKERGIPVYELQHGLIGTTHGAYNYPNDVNLKTFPDYLLSWGEYHTKGVGLPIPNKNIIPVGFPYLDNFNKEEDIVKEDLIVIISQRRDDIVDFSYKFAQKLFNYSFIFKAHPTEYQFAKKKYKNIDQLENVNVQIGDEPNLYSLMKKSKYVMGVNSTVLIEAIALGCKVLIMDLPGASAYGNLIDNVNVIKCTEYDHLSLKLDSGKCIKDTTSLKADYYFKDNAIENIKNIIDK